MLRAVPTGTFSWKFAIHDDDRKLALMDIAWTREAGTLVLDEGT